MKQNEPIVSSSCHCINIRRAANAVTGYYDTLLSEAGLTLNQYSLLSNIRKIEPCSVAQLSRRVRLERTTLVRNLKVLYAMGWIQNNANPGNRKGQILLTDAGVQTIASAKPYWEKAQAEMEKCLGVEEMQILTKSLLRLEELSRAEAADGIG